MKVMYLMVASEQHLKPTRSSPGSTSTTVNLHVAWEPHQTLPRLVRQMKWHPCKDAVCLGGCKQTRSMTGLPRLQPERCSISSTTCFLAHKKSSPWLKRSAHLLSCTRKIAHSSRESAGSFFTKNPGWQYALFPARFFIKKYPG